MPLRIFNNLSSAFAQNRLEVNRQNLGEAITRIASGNRLVGGTGNAAEKATSELLRSDTRTLRQASKNLNDGIGLVNVTESGLGEQAGILIRLRELATIAGGAIGTTERGTLQLEVNTLIEEFDRLANATEFNGQKLLDGSLDASLATNDHVVINVGLDSNASSQIDLNNVINLKSADSVTLGLDAVSTETFEGAADSLAIVEAALNTISGYRASVGATQNRFSRALSTLNVSIQNLTAAYSAIQDTDVAEELVDLTKQQLLVQSSTAMVGQANLIPEGVLSLLQ
ncbi:MAG: flagellin FliC [Nitrospina sp.]|jgi:flagellin|nr:flagellin FliC [Nitrospina sp.]MBT3414976.1 flagellin FliC [Nitrospina sp.]MBT3856629.1 flagellin FliC [Nitrospina sp.]MBT4103558.1 flagellin FliC [Nitrospina sp.]MBT4388735.1 flagellin FliC [Nitrospina sp.]